MQGKAITEKEAERFIAMYRQGRYADEIQKVLRICGTTYNAFVKKHKLHRPRPRQRKTRWTGTERKRLSTPNTGGQNVTEPRECDTCAYWRSINGVGTPKVCYFSEATGRCRSMICKVGECKAKGVWKVR